MAFSLDHAHRANGTRFRLYSQSPFLEGFEEPDTVWLSSPAGSLGPGPSDRRMRAIHPIGKTPYGATEMPPYLGPVAAPATPDAQGHFDHIHPDDPAFLAAHMFGGVRRVLDVWEMYLGGPIPWHFAITHPQLEMIPRVDWDNAHFGWGYMEFGAGADDSGTLQPYALNFDILAHEAGHGLVFSLVGMPMPGKATTAYRGFHESASDCVAMIAALHFDRFIDQLLEGTEGDLYVQNELNCIGELSKTRQIRIASNALTLDDVISVDTPPEEVKGKQIHELGLPLTGAVFDIGVEFFENRLVEHGAIDAEHAAFVRRAAQDQTLRNEDRERTVEAYRRNPAVFRTALCEARDMLGLRLAQTWHRLNPQTFSFGRFANTFWEVDRRFSRDRHSEIVTSCFQWRGISMDA